MIKFFSSVANVLRGSSGNSKSNLKVLLVIEFFIAIILLVMILAVIKIFI